MSEPVRRLEILTGSGRRRVWSAEQKEEIVAETLMGGESVSARWRADTCSPGAVRRGAALSWAPAVTLRAVLQAMKAVT
jgi:transposase-like protein